jgi:hypothetical protein
MEKIRVMEYNPETGIQFIVGFADGSTNATRLTEEFCSSSRGNCWMEHPSAPASKTVDGKVHFSTAVKNPSA